MTGVDTRSHERALEKHESFRTESDGYRLVTTVFEAVVTVSDEGDSTRYDVVVTVPTIDSATKDEVGPTVRTDWFETFERRVRDAPQATRVSVDLDEFEVREDGDTVSVGYGFTRDDPDTGVEIAKTLVEFAEGTYVEGVIPGYEYRPPVSDLLANASQSEDGMPPL